ncbi:MAG: hypothetical protein CMJ49_02195 [Planctomycetaceae bacterium]|nr:hypothetical protein [Planctomycetaceae bacterium]
MGTFHDNLGALHGITVVVELTDGGVIVGRCHEATDEQVLLHDADVHHEADGELSRADYLKRAAQWGVFAKHKSLRVAGDQVTQITPLGQIEAN